VIPDDDKDANIVGPLADADEEDVIVPPDDEEEEDGMAPVKPKPVTNKTL